MKKNLFYFTLLLIIALSGCKKEENVLIEDTSLDDPIEGVPFFFVEKGDTIAKDIYRKKPLDLQDEIILTTSEDHYVSKSTMALTPYVTDLYVIAGTHSGITPPTPYIKLGTDLNIGAGGKYIYLCYTKQDVAGPLKGLEIYSGANSWPSPSISYPWSQGVVANSEGKGYPGIDLNWGCGGDYIYLYQTRVAGQLNPYEGYTIWGTITEIGVYSANSSSSSQVPYGWKRIPKDINQGAGGKYVYIIYKSAIIK